MESTNSQAGKSAIDPEFKEMPKMETEPSGEPKISLEQELTQEQTRCIICLEDWVFGKNEEHKTEHKGNLSDLWISVEKPQGILNRLIPCNHFECNSCFVNYHQKTGKSTCPVCQVAISSYSIINSFTLTESSPFRVDFQESPTPQQDESNLFESFDHQYFEHEIEKLIQLRTTVEHERFHARRNFGGQTSMREIEWQSLKQIEQRLFDIQEDIFMMEMFDSSQRMREVHEIHDTLCKIRAGKLEDNRDCFGFKASFDINGFDDDLNDDYLDIKIKGMSNKDSKKLMDPIQFMLDGGKKNNGGSKKQNKKNRKGKGKIVQEIMI